MFIMDVIKDQESLVFAVVNTANTSIGFNYPWEKLN